MTETRWLNADEQHTWRAYLASHRLLLDAIDAQIAARHRGGRERHVRGVRRVEGIAAAREVRRARRGHVVESADPDKMDRGTGGDHHGTRDRRGADELPASRPREGADADAEREQRRGEDQMARLG